MSTASLSQQVYKHQMKHGELQLGLLVYEVCLSASIKNNKTSWELGQGLFHHQIN